MNGTERAPAEPTCSKGEFSMMAMGVAVFFLAACSPVPSGSPAPLPCVTPVTLPDRALSDRDVEIYWGRDRSALRECGARVAAMGAIK